MGLVALVSISGCDFGWLIARASKVRNRATGTPPSPPPPPPNPKPSFFRGLEFRVQGLGFRVSGFGFRV